MTTDALLRLIERCRAGYAEVTIDTLAVESGRPRRTIERAIETARLEGRPIITDGGVRLATTAEEATALGDWLDARMDSQRRTRDAVYAAALLLPGPVRPEAPEPPVAGVEAPTLWPEGVAA